MADTRGGLALAIVAILVAMLVIVSEATLPQQSVLHLERISTIFNDSLDHHSIRAHDRLRHSWMLQQTISGVADFPLETPSDPFTLGVYFTRVKLGSSPREFRVVIDTGSNIPWVMCSSCTTCPRESAEGVAFNFFDPLSSSSAHVFRCSDPLCDSKDSPAQCSPTSNRCVYYIQYEDGTTSTGYFVRDNMIFDMVTAQSLITNYSATVVFGCSNYQDGGSSNPDMAFDGLFGFGQGVLSIISQFYMQGLAPKVFSHCLSGGLTGGGIMVLGEIMEPGITHTPLVPSRSYYSIHLEGIAVNAPVVFEPHHKIEIIIDSGTTFTYLVEDAYNSLINSITAIVSPSFTPITRGELQCYLVPTGINETDFFPMLIFNFARGASIVLKPEQYILHLDGPSVGCTIFIQSRDSISILGELIMRDMIVVYDLARQRIGWAPFDCSKSVNVSLTHEKVHGGAPSSSLCSSLPVKFTAIITILLLPYIF